MRTILLVEPDEAMRDALRSTLLEMGNGVHLAGSGNEAVRWHAGFREPLHLLVSEVELPDFSALYLVDHLLALRPGLMILLTSWRPREHLRALGHDVGELMLLRKPARSRDVQEAVRKLLGDGVGDA